MRDQIRNEIAEICPLDTLEQEHLALALAWVDSGAELCRLVKPATPPMHLVAYVVIFQDEHVLLVDHKNAQLWLPVGGHVEPSEHPRSTALRELHEELGWQAAQAVAAPLMLTCTTTVGLTAGHTDVSLWYVVSARHDQPITFDQSEFNNVRWFAFDEVPLGRADPHWERFLKKISNYTDPGCNALAGDWFGQVDRRSQCIAPG